MEDNLSHITYASKLAFAQKFNRNLFKQINEISAINNQALGITGFLLFKDGKFFQYLEGEPSVLKIVIEKIKLGSVEHSKLQPMISKG